MFNNVIPISNPKSFAKAGIPTKNIRQGSPIGFTCKGPKHKLNYIMRSVNFIQEIWIKRGDSFLDGFDQKDIGFENEKYLLVIPFMAASELLEKTYNGTFSDSNFKLLPQYLAGNKVNLAELFHKAVNCQSSSTQHVHGLHKFKAKFFPRFVRSMIVSYIEDVPVNKNGIKTILDPFVGSGTALVEASILGFRSFGIDIDRLSCEISKAKLEILKINYNTAISFIREIENLIKVIPRGVLQKNYNFYQFPSIIAQKFERWNTNDEKAKYEREISSILDFYSSIQNPTLKTFIGICISDALCKKYNIRMMGTGSGRFALEITHTELISIMVANLKNLAKILFSIAILKKKYDIIPASSEVYTGNAKKMPFSKHFISLIVTSPPYLPASSGRENYLVGKAISMTALGLVKDKELASIDQSSIGSIKANKSKDDGNLPESVYHLVHWLENDPLRNIKARPILNYYLDLVQSLKESIRVLVPGGLAVYIIGKTSTFYNAKTRDIVYQVKCDDIFSQLAKNVGFNLIGKSDIELDKKNKNARPRSLDSYFESAFTLQKPS